MQPATCELQAQVVKLEPMRVASVRAYSATPERDAWELLRAWAKPQGLLSQPDTHPVFGFNNPNPSPDRKEYGYELWLRIEPGAWIGGDVQAKDFHGGRYAVTTCRLQGEPGIGETWRRLWEWAEANSLKWRHSHELEKVRNPDAPEADMIVDLYLPVE